MAKEEGVTVKAEVLEQFAGDKFLVKLDNGKTLKVYLGGSLRKNHIRVIIGDIVDVLLCPYDITNGKITFRYKSNGRS